MNAGSLLDQSRKFVILGQDERIWLFVYEPTPDTDTGLSDYYWQAYSQKPGLLFVPEGPWAEDAIVRFLEKHGTHPLDSEDKLDLLLYLHLGGLEVYLKKNRIKGEQN
jgi:hypothetical protein